jgi:hypothetical protein
MAFINISFTVFSIVARCATALIALSQWLAISVYARV